METFTRFLYEFLAQFFSGLGSILKGLWERNSANVQRKSI